MFVARLQMILGELAIGLKLEVLPSERKASEGIDKRSFNDVDGPRFRHFCRAKTAKVVEVFGLAEHPAKAGVNEIGLAGCTYFEMRP